MPESAAYFTKLQSALMEAGIAQPTLVIDRERLDANIETFKGHLPPGMGYRIVAKSLPSLPLLSHIRQKTGTDRMMTFNLDMLLEIAHAMPDVNQLLGKPMPVAAARAFYRQAPADAHVQWLIDTPERLDQYLDLAGELGVHLDIVFEIDVGLHRGGFPAAGTLKTAWQKLEASNTASFTGLMGYEPHIAKMPEKHDLRARAKDFARETYEAARTLTGCSKQETSRALTLNTAGSPTYRLYTDTSMANEVSAGSVLVKPTDFDTDLLSDHVPASFIAAPALKVLNGINVAGFDFLEGRKPEMPEGHSKTIYTFGGNWMAKPVWPPEIVVNEKYGRSSNQQMLTAPPTVDLKPDEFVFFRPTQSEAVFLQFGDIAVFDGRRIVDRWPVFKASA